MAYRTLDLTLVSARDLKNVSLFTPMRVYALVSLSYDAPRSRQRIAPDRDGGRNPNWNATLQFTIPAGDPGSLALLIRLRADRMLGDRDVGVVHVPLRDIRTGGTQMLSYQVRRPISGKPKGIINFSYRLSDPIAPLPAYPPFPISSTSAQTGVPEAVTAYPSYGASMPAYQGYATQTPYGYPAPMPAGYGYSPSGYPAAGYPPAAYGAPAKPGKKGGSGMGMAAGIMGGAIGGLLVGDMISDASAYDAGFDDGLSF